MRGHPPPQRPFAVQTTPEGRLLRRHEMPAGAAREAVAAHGEALEGRDGRIVKRSAETLVTIVPLEGAAQHREVCVKQFRFRGLLHALKDWIRPSPARRSWTWGRRLEGLGIGAPRVLAVLLRPFWALRADSFLVMEVLRGTQQLDEFARTRLGDLALRRRRDFLAQAAAFLRRMHDEGVYHGDLKASNVLVREEGDGFGFFLVDLAAVRRPWRLGRGSRLRNLAQLHASLPPAVTWADRLRFLRAYNGVFACLRDERDAARAIGRLAAGRKRNWGGL